MDVVWRSPQPQNLRIVSNRNVQLVVPWREQEGIARGTELIILLCGVNLVDTLLHRRGSHGRVENDHVGSEVRLGTAGRHYGRDGIREQPENQHELDRHSTISDPTWIAMR